MIKKYSHFIFMLFLLCLFTSTVWADNEPSQGSEQPEKPMITVQYNQSGTTRTFQAPFYDELFLGDDTVFNLDLAQASVGFTVSAYRDLRVPDARDCHILDFFDNTGFENVETYWYDHAETSAKTLSTSLASKKIGDFTLIACAAAGAGYQMEWAGNLTVGTGERHEGFDYAAGLCKQRLSDYIEKYQITGEKRIWIVGYSRAAAVGNIVAADLTASGEYAEVYTYLLAPPTVTTGSDYNDEMYNNIFNMLGQNDPVPNVPLTSWGFHRYGIDKYLPAQESNSSYITSALIADAFLKEFSGASFRNNPELNRQLHVVFEYLAEILPTRDDYVRSLQPVILSVLEDFKSEDTYLILEHSLKQMEAIDPVQKSKIDDLIEYLEKIVYVYASGNKSQVTDGSWSRGESIGNNLVLEHQPYTYVCWLLSGNSEEMLFPGNTKTTRYVISGDVEVDISDNYGEMQWIGANGEIEIYSPDGDGRSTDGDVVFIHAERKGKQTILSIPGDREFTLNIHSLSDQTLALFDTEYQCGVLSGNDSQVSFLNVEKDHTYTTTVTNGEASSTILDEHGDKVLCLTDDLEYDTNALVAMEALGSNEFSILDVVKPAIVLGVLILITFLFIVLLFIIRRIRWKKIKHSFSPAMVLLPHIVLSILLALLSELFCKNLGNAQNIKIISFILAGITTSVCPFLAFIRNNIRKCLAEAILIFFTTIIIGFTSPLTTLGKHSPLQMGLTLGYIAIINLIAVLSFKHKKRSGAEPQTNTRKQKQ